MSKAPTIERRGSRLGSADDVYRYLSDIRNIVDREHLVVLDLDDAQYGRCLASGESA
ncbi:MAG: hypothetical protein ABJA82_18220 [Myxococcales bacterium]